MATGHPPAGGFPFGRSMANPSLAADRADGVRLVGTCGMTAPRVTNCGERNDPNAYHPTLPGSVMSYAVLECNGAAGFVEVWSLRWMPSFITPSASNTVVTLP